MNINKMIFRGIRVGIMLVMVLLIVYGTMQAGALAYEYGYRFAIESLVNQETDTESTGK